MRQRPPVFLTLVQKGLDGTSISKPRVPIPDVHGEEFVKASFGFGASIFARISIFENSGFTNQIVGILFLFRQFGSNCDHAVARGFTESRRHFPAAAGLLSKPCKVPRQWLA